MIKVVNILRKWKLGRGSYKYRKRENRIIFVVLIEIGSILSLWILINIDVNVCVYFLLVYRESLRLRNFKSNEYSSIRILIFKNYFLLKRVRVFWRNEILGLT